MEPHQQMPSPVRGFLCAKQRHRGALLGAAPALPQAGFHGPAARLLGLSAGERVFQCDLLRRAGLRLHPRRHFGGLPHGPVAAGSADHADHRAFRAGNDAETRRVAGGGADFLRLSDPAAAEPAGNSLEKLRFARTALHYSGGLRHDRLHHRGQLRDQTGDFGVAGHGQISGLHLYVAGLSSLRVLNSLSRPRWRGASAAGFGAASLRRRGRGSRRARRPCRRRRRSRGAGRRGRST